MIVTINVNDTIFKHNLIRTKTRACIVRVFKIYFSVLYRGFTLLGRYATTFTITIILIIIIKILITIMMIIKICI